jgi:hypothetical protein
MATDAAVLREEGKGGAGMTKPVIRYRSGRWICRGAGHQGSSRSPVAAWCAWRNAVLTGTMEWTPMRRKA